MIYLSQLLGNPVLDADGEKIGTVSDLGIATGEVFPRVTSLAFMGPGRTPIMISWRKYVERYDENEVNLKVVNGDVEVVFGEGGMEHVGPVMAKLRETLTGIQDGELAGPEGWVVKIC